MIHKMVEQLDRIYMPPHELPHVCSHILFWGGCQTSLPISGNLKFPENVMKIHDFAMKIHAFSKIVMDFCDFPNFKTTAGKSGIHPQIYVGAQKKPINSRR